MVSIGFEFGAGKGARQLSTVKSVACHSLTVDSCLVIFSAPHSNLGENSCYDSYVYTARTFPFKNDSCHF